MGACATNGEYDIGTEEERARDRQVQKKLNAAKHDRNQVHKLLLLGAGQSGKSTLFKQMVSIYGEGFDNEELESYRPIIYDNVVSSMQVLLEQADYYRDKFEKEGGGDAKKFELGEGVAATRAIVDNAVAADKQLDETLAGAIDELWKEPAIKETYAKRSEYQLNESAAYFFDKVKILGDAKYVPSEHDILRARARTTGVVENNFVIDGSKFSMFDVGGQRSERKKWIHCFEGVTVVLFVAAISAYDLRLFEDNSTNRLVEAIELFQEVTNSRWFTRTTVVLFLNKIDIYKEKYKNTPITVCPPLSQFTGDLKSFEETTEFIIDNFLEKNLTEKNITPHLTCATDRENVNVVFDAVKETVLKKSLEEAGIFS